MTVRRLASHANGAASALTRRDAATLPPPAHCSPTGVLRQSDSPRRNSPGARLHRPVACAIALLLPTTVAAQTPTSRDTTGVMPAFVTFADIFGGRLVDAFDSIPAAKYGYRPTPVQQSIGYIAQHLENANYGLCERLADRKHPVTAKDSLADTVKARWPKDTLVARLRASLRYCDAVLEALGPLDSQARASTLLAFETDLAEHYSQLSVYMRLLGMVPPSALLPRARTAVDLPPAALSPYVGVYQLSPGPQLEVTMRDGVLFIRSSGGGATVRLWAESGNDFFVKEVDAQVTFTRDTAGGVTGLVLHQYGRDRPAKRIP